MATITYKCPNCDADLTYRPGTKDFGCNYCGSSFTEEQLDSLLNQDSLLDEQQETLGNAESSTAVVYTCPSCGAELVTDSTTAATFCFYCHNPVIMAGQLSGEFTPDSVIPFEIPKEKVKQQLIEWCKSKKFIDDGFFSEMQLEKLTGVYFPFWLVDGKVSATYAARSNSLKVWVVGDIEYTETTQYAHLRGGDIDMNDLTIGALDRQDAELLNGVYPYNLTAVKKFDMKYLSGFFAEKRNIEKKSVEPKAAQTARKVAEERLESTVVGYGALTGQQLHIDEETYDWQYALMPAWMMTYRYKDELYYFAMNGQTGKIAGRVPVSTRKINRLAGIIAIAGTVLGAVMGGIMWL
ncbi:MAG: TFIIB-type zinc ribbon-containing protein [Clostridia bacterium]|nr:TFIIB-type zinc ribbon-containing protein [Clostridia bacterium]